MTVIAYSRGWKIEYCKNKWVYSDTKNTFDDSRPCKRCGNFPTKEGFDFCVGYVSNAKSVCCGHGVEKGFIL